MSVEEKEGKKETEVPEGGVPEWALRLQKSVDSLTKTLTERKESEQITEPIVKVPVPQTPPEPEEMDEQEEQEEQEEVPKPKKRTFLDYLF